MKLTKSRLKQLIKEELSVIREPWDEPDELPETEGDLLEELKKLLDDWRPDTDEGIQYKNDLAEVVEQYSEGYSEEEEELVDVGGEGLAGETAEKTLADYKENPEYFN